MNAKRMCVCGVLAGESPALLLSEYTVRGAECIDESPIYANDGQRIEVRVVSKEVADSIRAILKRLEG